MKSPSRPLAPIRAFTLIELLTVIAIVAVLAAILIPAVGKVREKAKEAECVSNMRQLALGLVQYAAAKQTLPTAFESDAPAGQGMWPYRLVDAGLLPDTYGSVGSLVEYEKVFHCPNDIPLDGSAQAHNSYSMNNTLSSDSGTWGDFNRPINVSDPAQMILLAEVHGCRDGKLYRKVFRSDWPSGYAAFDRHGGRSVYAFMDGHVEVLAFEETYDETNGIDLWTPTR
jgi:prepilin-type N-terminal cleavage/methylation domain-containing protein/prepilin-type processing-associated H-X9-DG protein